jgi:uncharacterized protein YegL
MSGAQHRPDTLWIRFFCFAAAALLAAGVCLYAPFDARGQSLQISAVDASNFPTVRSKMYCLDERGLQMRSLSPEQFTLTENGLPRTVRAIACPPILGVLPPLSVVLAIDVSGSMEGAGIQLVRHAAEAFIMGLPLQSECAITSFNSYNTLITDFTSQKSKLIDAFHKLKPGGGTDYEQGLLEEPAGALAIAKEARKKRVVVFLTDGLASADAQKIVAVASTYNASVYCIVVGLNAPPELRAIATETGGGWYENINSAERAREIYLEILQRAQSISPCEIEWEGGASCDQIQRVSLQFAPLRLAAETSYKLPTRWCNSPPNPPPLPFARRK